MVVKPLGSNIFVELIEVGERKVGMIHIPGKHQEPSRIGVVLEVGPDVTRLKKGDKIMISFYSGTGVDYLGCGFHYDTHRFMSEMDVLGTYEES
jgi:co-chaperonin GroES (HSP10)